MSQNATFISKVCKWVIENQSANLHELTIVVPAKRSIRFFSNELVAEFTAKSKASILPEIITLTDLFDQLSPLSKLTQVELVFHFYTVYSKLELKPDTFEEFFTWAPSLLSDFNEIDNYLIDPKALYTDLRNIKEQEIIIEGWSFERPTLSKSQTLLNEYWMKFPVYYKELKKYLIENKLGYSGLINRSIAENIQNTFENRGNRTFVFAGFNAMTKCEVVVLNYLIEHKRSKVFFDTDSYYKDNKLHEAGLFMRNHQNDFNGKVEFLNANALTNSPKNISYYESNGEALQCQEVVKQLLQMKAHELEKTAIVLCNEQLLPILINALPKSLLMVNVTMGWPLKFTKANDFFNALIDLNIAFSRNKNFIQHELIDYFILAANSFLEKNIANVGQVLNRADLLSAYENSSIGNILNSTTRSITQFLNACLKYIGHELSISKPELINTEVLAHYNEVFNKILLLPGFEEHISSWFIFKQLFNKFTRNYPIAFVGEPLAGIQVMGMLETRALDFETVFILSANEGFLPAQQLYTGYIPYDLRAYYKLPGKTEQDAVFAYYFYRLLQFSKNIHVLYNTQNELLQQSERSRYLLQIEKELAEKNRNIILTTNVVDARLDKIAEQFVVEKSPFYFERLNQLMVSGFSASMMLTFCKCKLDFYHKFILGFKEAKDPHVLDESGLGNMVHYYFNSIFSKITNEKTSTEFFKNELDCLRSSVDLIIEEKFLTFNFASGQNYLALQMVIKMISSFLQKQLNPNSENVLLGKTVVGSEIDSAVQLTIAGQSIKLKGNIDLLLKDDANNYFVFDFKTGRVNQEDLEVSIKKELSFKFFTDHEKLIQLLIYKKLVEDNYKTNSVTAFIIPLATGSSKILATHVKDATDEDVRMQFFTGVVDEMLNKKNSIVHSESSKFCEFCY
jgi:ATP-dependent helicase/nuclease subunit B